MPHWTCDLCGARLYSASEKRDCPICTSSLARERQDESRFDRKAERAATGPRQGQPDRLEHPHPVPPGLIAYTVPAKVAGHPASLLRSAAEEALERADERDRAAELEEDWRAREKLRGEASDLRNLAVHMDEGETLKGQAARAWWDSLTSAQRMAIVSHLESFGRLDLEDGTAEDRGPDDLPGA